MYSQPFRDKKGKGHQSESQGEGSRPPHSFRGALENQRRQQDDGQSGSGQKGHDQDRDVPQLVARHQWEVVEVNLKAPTRRAGATVDPKDPHSGAKVYRSRPIAFTESSASSTLWVNLRL